MVFRETRQARAAWLAGVDVLAVADETDSEPVQLIEHLKKSSALNAIAGPDQHPIGYPGALALSGIEAGAARLRR